jgi:hypothetical protein
MKLLRHKFEGYAKLLYGLSDIKKCHFRVSKTFGNLLTLGGYSAVTVVVLCVCEFVCYRTTGYIPRLELSSAVL